MYLVFGGLLRYLLVFTPVLTVWPGLTPGSTVRRLFTFVVPAPYSWYGRRSPSLSGKEPGIARDSPTTNMDRSGDHSKIIMPKNSKSKPKHHRITLCIHAQLR